MEKRCPFCGEMIDSSLEICNYCGNNVNQIYNSNGKVNCQPPQYPQYQQYSQYPQQQNVLYSVNVPRKQKSHLVYVLLWLFFGQWGCDSYYIGSTGKGLIKTLVYFLTFIAEPALGILIGIGFWIWGLVDLCINKTDAYGIPFK